MFRRISRREGPAAFTALVVLTAGLLTGCGASIAAAPMADPSPAAAAQTGDDVLSISRVHADVKAGRINKDSVKADVVGLDHPLSPTESKARFGVPVYGATALRRAYGLDKLPRSTNGHMPTVALIMPYRNPTYTQSIATYAKQYGLPTGNVTVMTHGQVPVANPDDPNQAVVPEEGLLDGSMIRALAQNAKLVYLQVNPNTLDGPDGFKRVGTELAWLTKRIHIDAISFSYGWFEKNYLDFFGSPAKAQAALQEQSRLVAQVVKRHHVTVLTADGDTGATGPTLDGTHLYPQPTPAFLASSPWVTAVSATTLHLDNQGNRVAKDTAWSETNRNGFATGGAPSAYFKRPGYQDHVRNVVGDHRGVGDIAMNGGLESQVWFYSPDYNALTGQAPGWIHAAGTSAASPAMAGIVADAVAVAGHPLGLINPALYRMARTPVTAAASGILDVTSGTNDAGGVKGYNAAVGYDYPTGLGTVGYAPTFVHVLAHAA